MSNALYNSYRFTSANSACIEGGKGGPPFTTDGPFAFDCSGFVYYVLKNSGYNVSYVSVGSGTFTKQGHCFQAQPVGRPRSRPARCRLAIWCTSPGMSVSS